MLPVKGNFCSSSKLKDKCPMRLDQLDTQEHLFQCEKIFKNTIHEIIYGLVYEERRLQGIRKQTRTA